MGAVQGKPGGEVRQGKLLTGEAPTLLKLLPKELKIFVDMNRAFI